MKNYDYYYYVVYEFPIKNGMQQSYCEYRRSQPISHLKDFQEMTKELQRVNDSENTPVIIFYSLLRQEERE